MRSPLKRILSALLLALFFVACSKKTEPALTQTPAVVSPSPAVAVAPAPPSAQAPSPPSPFVMSLDGSWTGSAGENMPVSFSVENNQVSRVNVSLKGKKGSCSFFSSFPSEAPSAVNGKSFTTHGKKDQFEFTLNGTFTSANEVSGTIDWKGTLDICGSIESQFKWTAKKEAPEAPDEN